jgi:hypothetical protein
MSHLDDATVEYGGDIPSAIRPERDANVPARVRGLEAIVLHILRTHEISLRNSGTQ